MEAKDFILIVTDKIRKRIIQEKVGRTGTEEEQDENDPTSALDTEEENSEEEKNTPEVDPFEGDIGYYTGAYYKILVFLWGMIHDQLVVHGTPLTPALNGASLKRSDSIHKNVFGEEEVQSGKQSSLADDFSRNNQFDPTGLQAVLSKFGTKIDLNTAASSSRKSDKSEKEDSEWMKLTPLSINVMEGMQARYNTDIDNDEDGNVIIPTGPSAEQKAIIQCFTGARVQQYINHSLITVHGCVVCMGVGMCTAIKKGLIMSQPTPNDPTNYSPHFTPPAADDVLSEES